MSVAGNEAFITKVLKLYDAAGNQSLWAYGDGGGGVTLELGSVGSLTSLLKVDDIQPLNGAPIPTFGHFDLFLNGGPYGGIFETVLGDWYQRFDNDVFGATEPRWWTYNPLTVATEPYQVLNGAKMSFDPDDATGDTHLQPFRPNLTQPSNGFIFDGGWDNVDFLVGTVSNTGTVKFEAPDTGPINDFRARSNIIALFADGPSSPSATIRAFGSANGSVFVGATSHVAMGSDTTEVARIDAPAFRFGVGIVGNTASAKLSVETTTVGDGAHLSAFGGAGSGEPMLALRAARGTQGGGASAPQSGDLLGSLAFLGFGTGGFGTACANIQAWAHGNFSNTNKPTSLRFFTTPPLSATPVERGRFTHDGEFRVGTTGQFSVNASGAIVSLNSVGPPSVAALVNSVTAGGTTDTISDFTDLIVYANDAATIRNDIYQLSRKLTEVVTALRNYGLLL